LPQKRAEYLAGASRPTKCGVSRHLPQMARGSRAVAPSVAPRGHDRLPGKRWLGRGARSSFPVAGGGQRSGQGIGAGVSTSSSVQGVQGVRPLPLCRRSAATARMQRRRCDLRKCLPSHLYRQIARGRAPRTPPRAEPGSSSCGKEQRDTVEIIRRPPRPRRRRR